MTDKRNRALLLLLTLILLAAVIFSITYAWLAGSNIIKSTVSRGSILTSYFHTGTGSEENPFVITRPIHFYNLIYLYQRLEGFADEGYYFQLGYQLLYDEDDAEPDENYYFYSYGDDGKIIPGQYTTVLNMKYYSDEEGMGGALLPIGTSDVPFVGTFDGKGLTVANLHITPSKEIISDTYASSDVGIFGYVGGEATIKNTYFSNVTIDLTGTDAAITTGEGALNEHDTSVHDSNSDGEPDLVYVGFLAGHIKVGSMVQHVYLNDCTVVGGDAARSGYGYFGCVEKADGGLVASLGSEIATLRGEGDSSGFGGSIDMNSVFTRLDGMIGDTATTVRTVVSEEVWIDEVAGTTEIRNQTYANSNSTTSSYNGSTVYYHESPYDGSYYMFQRTNSGSWTVVYLYGENNRNDSKTVTTYTLKDEFDEDGLLISIGGSYLNATTSGVSAGNDEENATIWQLDNAGHLNALLEESTQYNTYYLNASANGTLSVSTTATTVWTKTEDANHEGTLTYTSGGRTWYLSQSGGTWAGYPFDSTFSISNGANYLVQSNSTTLAGTAGNHADWHFEGGKLMTFINKTIYYLNASAGSLSLGTNAGSATTWTDTGSGYTYTDANSRVWTLAYNGGWCCVPFVNGFTISNSTNYLGYNGSAVTSVASGSALHFALEGGKLVTFYNNTLYYLNASAGSLSLGTSAGSATTWTDTGTGFTYTDGNSRVWTLCYNNGWYCVPFTSGFTIANNTNYVGYSGSAVTSVASGSALHFALEGGKLVTSYNNTLYYLNASANGTLSLGTNAGSATTWTKTEDGNHAGTLTYTSGGRTWYLSYDGSAWAGYPFDSAFSIYNGANYLVQSSSTTLAGTAGNHAGWHFEGGKLMTFINKTIYYLNASAGSLSLGTSEGSATTWTQNGNVFSYTDGNSRVWYLAYDGGWHCVPFASGFTIANGANYLGYNGTALTAVASGSALHFSFEDGKVVTYYNNTLYYLTATGGTLSLTTSVPSITWVKGANTLSYTDAGSRTWYLRYLNGAWDLYPSLSSYTIRSGNSYFGVSGSNVTLTNQAGAANWSIDGSKLYTVSNGTLYYLVGSTDGSGTLSLTPTRANGTDWTYTQGGGTMSYTGNGETWYLYVQNSAWTVLPGMNYNLISQNGSYLRATSATAVDGTTEANASAWYIDGSGHIYTFYSGARRYLTASGTTVSLSNSGTTVWTRNGNNTVTDARGWYLVYDAGWKCYPLLSYVLITDGTNYLTRNGNSGVTNTTTSASASKWFADGSKFFTLDDAGTAYYLAANTTALSVTTTAGNGTAFSYDGTNKRLSYIVGSTTYYVIYNSGWKVNQNYQTSSTIKASTGNYFLNANTTTVSTETSAGSATEWYYNASTGRLYTEIASVKYYLQAVNEQNNKYGSTNMKMTSDENAATAFTYSGNHLTCTLNGTTYSLSLHDNTFKMVDTAKNYYTFRYYSNPNPYLSLNGSTYSNPTDQNDAVLWELSTESLPGSNYSSTSTSISTLVNGTRMYINLNGSLTLTETNTNLQIYRYNSTNYYYIRLNSSNYLRYNSGWTWRNGRNNDGRITRSSAIRFTQATLTFNGAIYETSEEVEAITATTTFTTTNALNNVTFTAAANGTTQTFGNVSENVTHTTASEADRNTNTMALTSENVTHTKTATAENITHTKTAAADRVGLDFETKRRQHIEKEVENNVKSGYPTYFPLRIPKSGDADYDANNLLKASQKNTGYIISGGNFYDGSTNGTKVGDIRVSEYAISNINGSWSTSGLTVTKIRSGTNYLYLEKDEEEDTYSIANTTDANLANFWQYSDSKLFTVIGKKTYWLTYDNGLKLSETVGVNWSKNNSNTQLYYNSNYIKYSGGAWVATTGSSTLTLTTGTMNNVYTYDGSGNHVLTAEQKTEAYQQALLQLTQTLVGTSNVYGLHFMNSEISEDHITTAGTASIFGATYNDYEFPEDSVDFHVIERGSISFFAGEYFTNNNAFFSLHQVYRYKADDAAVLAGTKKVNDIKHIKEISEIYKHATSGDSVNYVYKFSDNTYSNPDGTYTGAVTLADGYSNTPVFRTSWITAPSGLSTNNKRIYFFEIPCNAGEYCLGSVSGKTGAYLIYLDIAANGGEELASAISGTGNDVIDSFQTEFRDSPDSTAHSILLLSYDAPDGATPETFSVNVTFDKTSAEALEDPHPNGLYTIDIVNKTETDVILYVYLCDDDYNLLTAFPYAYKVHYVNTTTGSGGTYLETTFGDTFQMMAGFTIPTSGEAIEISYH